MLLLSAALCLAAGPLHAWDPASACAGGCCCGIGESDTGPGRPAVGAADDCSCEADAPTAPVPTGPTAPATPKLSLDLHVFLACPAGSTPWLRGERVPNAPEPAATPPPSLPARLLHCSLTL
jgi:hypothetical protein